jgi:hypothetical protein
MSQVPAEEHPGALRPAAAQRTEHPVDDGQAGRTRDQQSAATDQLVERVRGTLRPTAGGEHGHRAGAEQGGQHGGEQRHRGVGTVEQPPAHRFGDLGRAHRAQLIDHAPVVSQPDADGHSGGP